MKLPATVAFPTDERLLARLEESRRALPPNSVKALWHARPSQSTAPRVSGEAPPDMRPMELVRASVQRLPARSESPTEFPQLVRIEELYARSRVALGQR